MASNEVSKEIGILNKLADATRKRHSRQKSFVYRFVDGSERRLGYQIWDAADDVVKASKMSLTEIFSALIRVTTVTPIDVDNATGLGVPTWDDFMRAASGFILSRELYIRNPE